MAAKPKSIDQYIANVLPEQRKALEHVRKSIRSAAPKAEEYIAYGLSAFRLDGKPLVAFGASSKHCAFYPMSGTTVDAFADDLTGYETSKGTIRFPADKPLSAALIRKLVKARIAENAVLKTAKAKKGGEPAVDEFMEELDHPREPEIEAIRKLILKISPKISEGIKWNSPSFRAGDWFATVNIHGNEGIRLILHTGAKSKEFAKTGLKIADPDGILKWLGKDRAMVVIADAADWKAKRKALQAVLTEWVERVS